MNRHEDFRSNNDDSSIKKQTSNNINNKNKHNENNNQMMRLIKNLIGIHNLPLWCGVILCLISYLYENFNLIYNNTLFILISLKQDNNLLLTNDKNNINNINNTSNKIIIAYNDNTSDGLQKMDNVR